MNEELLKLYQNLCSKAAETIPAPLLEHLLCPFFTCPREGWRQADKRIVIVGQEPHDWGFEAGLHYPWPHPPLWSLSDTLSYEKGVEALMSAYREHTYELVSPYRVAAFGMAFNRLMSSAKRGEGTGDVIATNLFRCALSTDDPDSRSPLRGTETELRQILDWQHGCLTEEIRILSPTGVVFFTGPNYDGILHDEFKGIEFVAIDERPVGQFAKLIHKSLPELSFRTYHPSYLKRDPKKWSWVEELAARLTES